MTKKQIKTEFPNEVDILRTTLAELKAKLPGLDEFLLANPECTKCSNSKDYHCVQLKGKPGCRTCTSRRISCSRHVQYLVETAASRLEWSVEKTNSMYEKYVKQTRTGRKSLSKVKKVSSRKAMDVPQTFESGGAADQNIAGGSRRRRNVAEPEGDDYESDGGSDSDDAAQRVTEDLENFSDEPEEYDDQDPDGNESTTNNFPHSVSNATLRASSSNTRAFPSNLQEEISNTIPVLEPEESDSLDHPGLHDSTSLPINSEKTVQRVDDSTQLTQREDEHGTQSEHAPELSMSPEQRIKQLEEKVAELNTLRRLDSSSISRLAKRADTAFDNMSVLLSRVKMHRQELGTIVSKHIEPPEHQKPFKSLIDKMDETFVSATQILVLLDKRKNYVIPKTRVPVIITDEEGQEWVPWDVISDDNVFRDVETEKKRRRDSEANNGEGSSKRRKS